MSQVFVVIASIAAATLLVVGVSYGVTYLGSAPVVSLMAAASAILLLSFLIRRWRRHTQA